MPAVVMATAGLYMLARDASNKKVGTGGAEADQKNLHDAGRDSSEPHADKVDVEKDWA